MLRAFPVSLTGAASRWLRNQPSGSITTWEVLKTKFLNKYYPPARTAKKMEEINNFRKNEKVYAAQVGCELYEGPHYTKDYPQKEEGNTLKEAYYTQFGAPYQPGGQYREAGPGFYQQNNGNSSYPDQRTNLEESLTKFMAKSAKRHMSKVLQEIRFGSLPSSTETNPRDQVKSISTTKADFSGIRRIGCVPYVVSGTQYKSLFSETVPFQGRLQNFACDDWREAQDVKILDAYDHTLTQKEKDPGNFTLPCFIHNIYFDKALVDLGASVSVMPFLPTPTLV
ncbi:retrovirus-related pol polyprotein from transposon TNT 1-94 [Tanacetum coccineum]